MAAGGTGPTKDHVYGRLDHLQPETLVERFPGISMTAKIIADFNMIKETAPGMPTVHYNTSGMPINCKTQVLRDETNVIVTGKGSAG